MDKAQESPGRKAAECGLTDEIVSKKREKQQAQKPSDGTIAVDF
jgi:hypothetical protein